MNVKKLKFILPMLMLLAIGFFSTRSSLANSPCNDCDGIVPDSYCGTIILYQYCGYNIANNQHCSTKCKKGCDECIDEIPF